MQDATQTAVQDDVGKAKSDVHHQQGARALNGSSQAQYNEPNAHPNSAGSKAPGSLFAKYKNMKERRRSHGSDPGDERQGNNEANSSLEYSPLGKGENGEGRVDIEATSSPYSGQVMGKTDP